MPGTTFLKSPSLCDSRLQLDNEKYSRKIWKAEGKAFAAINKGRLDSQRLSCQLLRNTHLKISGENILWWFPCSTKTIIPNFDESVSDLSFLSVYNSVKSLSVCNIFITGIYLVTSVFLIEYRLLQLDFRNTYHCTLSVF